MSENTGPTLATVMGSEEFERLQATLVSSGDGTMVQEMNYLSLLAKFTELYNDLERKSEITSILNDEAMDADIKFSKLLNYAKSSKKLTEYTVTSSAARLNREIRESGGQWSRSRTRDSYTSVFTCTERGKSFVLLIFSASRLPSITDDEFSLANYDGNKSINLNVYQFPILESDEKTGHVISPSSPFAGPSAFNNDHWLREHNRLNNYPRVTKAVARGYRQITGRSNIHGHISFEEALKELGKITPHVKYIEGEYRSDHYEAHGDEYLPDIVLFFGDALAYIHLYDDSGAMVADDYGRYVRNRSAISTCVIGPDEYVCNALEKMVRSVLVEKAAANHRNSGVNEIQEYLSNVVDYVQRKRWWDFGNFYSDAVHSKCVEARSTVFSYENGRVRPGIYDKFQPKKKK